MGKKGKSKKKTKKEKENDRTLLIKAINRERKKQGILPYHRDSFNGYSIKDLKNELNKERS